MSGDFLGIGHKLRNTREAESKGQRFVGNHWKFEFLLRSGGRGWSFKKSRDFIFGGPLDEAKKNCLNLRTKSRPEFLAGPKLIFHRSLLFFVSQPLNRRQSSHSVFWREISKFLSSDFIFGFLFEHQFNNLIEFSENNFLWSDIFWKLVETWRSLLECKFG